MLMRLLTTLVLWVSAMFSFLRLAYTLSSPLMLWVRLSL